MRRNTPLLDDWPRVLALLPDDLDASARQFGALRRKRAIRHGADLVRLALAYALGQRSLRATATWAEQIGLASLSDVAVLQRLRKSGAWLGHLVAQLLLARAAAQGLPALPYRLRVLDATTVQRPGSRGTDFRVHASLDLARLQFDALELTDASGGESLTRYPIQPGDLVLGDRGLAHRRGIHAVTAAGGDVLVRLTWQNLPLQPAAGAPLDLLATLRALADGAPADLTVQTAPSAKDGLPAIPGRLVAIRRDAKAAAETRRRVQTRARKQGKTPSAQTLEAAAYLFLFTTVPAEHLAAEWVLALYRFRWQIELAFKRQKSLLHLDALTAKDPALCRTAILANLLGGLLVEEVSHRFLALSPPAGRPAPPREPLAADPGDGRGAARGDRDHAPAGGVARLRAPGPVPLPRSTPPSSHPIRLDHPSPTALSGVKSA
jgi:Transposase DDE domain